MIVLEYKPNPLALLWHRSAIRGDDTRELARQAARMMAREVWSDWRLVHSRTGETVST